MFLKFTITVAKSEEWPHERVTEVLLVGTARDIRGISLNKFNVGHLLSKSIEMVHLAYPL